MYWIKVLLYHLPMMMILPGYTQGKEELHGKTDLSK